jgi:Protein of unknown function (DUF1571)
MQRSTTSQTNRRAGLRRCLAYSGAIALVTLLVGAGQAPVAPEPSAPGAGGIMDAPLRLVAEARQAYQGVTDYTSLFVKRERLRDQLQPENVMLMKVRTQPFSVYLRWLRPNNLANQEACYVTGRNNGMMRVHSTGLLGAVGFVSLDPRDPRALQNSRHTITEAGIGNLIERYAQRWEMENRLNKTQVRIAEYEYNKRRCVRVETIHPDNTGGQFLFYRSVVYFDKENHLPIRVENYDWPRSGGDPNGALAESYSYADLRLNAGVNEATFDH